MRIIKIHTLNGLIGILVVAATVLLFVPSAWALNFVADSSVGTTFSFADVGRSASADFSFAGDTVTVTLTNTFGGDVPNPIHVLQALFFDLTGNVALTPESGLLAPGSVVLYGSDGGGDVGGEFAYSSSLVGAPSGALQGISGVGYGLFGFSDLFPGLNLGGPEAVNGMNYGLLSAGYVGGGNPAVTGNFPLIKNSVIYTFSDASGLGIDDVSNVSFEYGTDLDRVPIPSTLLLLGIGLIGLGLARRRMKG